MSGIKLEYNKENIVIQKINNLYQINSIKQWIFLTKFKRAYLIIQHPYGCVETIVDRKFVYNQDYELICDLDFNYRYIYPLGNYPENRESYLIDIVPFTGTFNGNNFKIMNINIINCNYNGLFGITKSSIINNLTLENVAIGDGLYNGSLVGKAYSTDISNIKIIGNIFMKGRYCSCFVGLIEGNCKNIDIIVDGEIEADTKSLVSNYYYGNIENVSVISNIQNNINCFDIINGRVKNIGFISWKTIPNVFYNQSKYHQISNCYYFQLNEEKLPDPQLIYNYYYRNLNEVNYDNIKNPNQWIKIGDNYYLNEIINYTNDNIKNETENEIKIKFYDIKSNETNIEGVYLDINGIFKGVDYLESFNKNKITIRCKKMENIYNRETNCSKELDRLNNKNLLIRLTSIKSHMDNNAKLDYGDKLVSENNSHRYEDYESDSQCVTSDEEDDNKSFGSFKDKINEDEESEQMNELAENEQNDYNSNIFIINKNLEPDEKTKIEALNKIQQELEQLEQEKKLISDL